MLQQWFPPLESAIKYVLILQTPPGDEGGDVLLRAHENDTATLPARRATKDEIDRMVVGKSTRAYGHFINVLTAEKLAVISLHSVLSLLCRVRGGSGMASCSASSWSLTAPTSSGQ
jgi:hypothetical protein